MSASIIGAVGETTEHAMICVRDGKLVDKLEIDSPPVFSPGGRIYASQTTTPQGSPDVPFLGPSVTRLVVIEQGRVKRLAEGEPLLFLHDGSILFQRVLPPTWISDEEIAWPDGRRTLHLFKAGKVSDYTFPGKPQTIDSIEIDAQGRGVVTGSDQGKRVVRAFNQFTSLDLTNRFKFPEEVDLGPARDGLFVIHARNRTDQRTQFFTYRISSSIN